MRVTRFVIVTYAYRPSCAHADRFIVAVCCNRLSSRCCVILCADKIAFVPNNIVKRPLVHGKKKIVSKTGILENGCNDILNYCKQLQMPKELHHVYNVLQSGNNPA